MLRLITKPIFFVFVSLLILQGCRQTPNRDSSFNHDIETLQKPWNKDPESSDGDFSFAIISDLTGGERERIFEVAVEQINRFEPKFILSVGDLIEGGTEDTTQLKLEWEYFDRRANKLRSPFFHLGGNHDLTNPTMRRFWNQRYGPTYYHFVYNEVLFLMMDSEDYPEKRMMEIYRARARALQIISGEIEGVYEESEYYHMQERKTGSLTTQQREYFADVIEEHPEVKWTFVFMHKPLWNNEEQSEWKKLEEVLSERNYTVINGHLHSFSHRIRNERPYITLGTTGGAQDQNDPNSFDHISWVKMENGQPVITHIRMDGILDESGHLPLGGDTLSFQAFKPLLISP